MNKKALEKETIVEILIALIVLFLIILALFWPGTGLLWKAAAKSYTGHNQSQESKLNEIEIPKEGVVVFDTLTKALLEGKNSKGIKCIVTHDDFPDFKDLKIVLSPTKEGGLWVVLKNKDDQVAKQTVIPGLSPCLVADYGARNFYSNYFEKGSKTPEFLPAQHAELTAKEILVADNTKYDLEDNDCCGNHKVNVLYKPDADHVCFIPLRDGGTSCEVNTAGILDDDCISNMEKGIWSKNIKPCPI